jgi:aldehyde dehydrogenase (NAD+)
MSVSPPHDLIGLYGTAREASTAGATARKIAGKALIRQQERFPCSTNASRETTGETMALPLSDDRTPSADPKALFELQREARHEVAACTDRQRKQKLQRLFDAIRAERAAIAEAVRLDFGKHPDETELTEIGVVQEEISHALAHLSLWMRPQRVPTPLTLAGGSSAIRYEPKGQVLILSPWNYPFQLALVPLVAAVAAGNTVILRPSDKVPNTARCIQGLIERVFPRSEVAVVLGGHELADELLELPFDHVFFTGSPAVGRKVMAAAAKHLASVTLELGGKSPVVVDASADVVAAAERLTWAKFVNAGQT